jgi:hypothetical protein
MGVVGLVGVVALDGGVTMGPTDGLLLLMTTGAGAVDLGGVEVIIEVIIEEVLIVTGAGCVDIDGGGGADLLLLEIVTGTGAGVVEVLHGTVVVIVTPFVVQTMVDHEETGMGETGAGTDDDEPQPEPIL